MRIRFVIAAFLCITLVGGGYVQAAEKMQAKEEYRIVFSVFDSSSAGRYSYLRNSVQAMLASRLASRDGLEVLEKTFSEAELIKLKQGTIREGLLVGGEQADYLLTGALFSLTTGLEIQIDLYPLNSQKEVLHFAATSPTPQTLITDVEKLSIEISQDVFGLKPDTAENTTTAPANVGSSAFVTAHPEAAYKRRVYSGTIIGIEGSGVTTSGRGARLDITVPMDLTAMAVGDVTGDGQQDILTMAGLELKLFKVAEKEIVLLAETRLPSGLVGHALNLADFDGDGRDEIYISATQDLSVSSMIMRYAAERGFQTIARSIRWYLRPIQVPGKGWQLAGQKRGIERIELVRPGIYLLSMAGNGSISEQSRLPLPEGINLFDFSYADLDGDGFRELVTVDRKEKIRVYSAGNELMWVSRKNYAGSKVYLGPSQGEAADTRNARGNFTVDEDSDRELIFVPGKILVTDIEGDGKEEIIVSEDKKLGFSYFNRLRFYDGGAIVSLAWNGSALVQSWRTGNFKGHVAGYGFSLSGAPANSRKTVEKTGSSAFKKAVGRLFVGSLPKSGSLAELLPGGATTKLTVYDLEFSKENPKKPESRSE